MFRICRRRRRRRCWCWQRALWLPKFFCGGYARYLGCVGDIGCVGYAGYFGCTGDIGCVGCAGYVGYAGYAGYFACGGYVGCVGYVGYVGYDVPLVQADVFKNTVQHLIMMGALICGTIAGALLVFVIIDNVLVCHSALFLTFVIPRNRLG